MDKTERIINYWKDGMTQGYIAEMVQMDIYDVTCILFENNCFGNNPERRKLHDSELFKKKEKEDERNKEVYK